MKLKHPRSWEVRLWIALALGLACGLGGEGLTFAWAQCRRAEETLAADFKVLAFLSEPLDDQRLDVVRDKLLYQPGVSSVAFVSKDSALEALGPRAADVRQAVMLLGENPLPAAFEVRLTIEGLSRLDSWAEDARALPGVGRVEFRPAQAQAILQARADRLYFAVLLGLGFWILAIASFFFLIPGFSEPSRAFHELWVSAPLMVWGAAGAALGAALALALIVPTQADSPFWTWPPFTAQAALVASGALGGWVTDRLLP